MTMDISFLRDFVAGWTAGMLGLFIGYPCDTIKIHQQVQNINLRTACTQVWRLQGIKGFYRGVSGPMLTNGIANSLFFGCYTSSLEYMCKNRVQANPGKTAEDLATYWEVFLGGVVGGFAQTIVSNPVELVKTQMQIIGKDSKGQSTTTWKVIKTIYSARGLSGFGIGYGSLLARDLHGNGVYTLSYVYLLDRAKSDSQNRGDTLPNPLHLFVAGGLAGILCWWCSLPIDVIKSRLQAQSIEKPIYTGIIDCANQVFKREGASAFTKGFAATTIRAFPANGMIFFTYEVIRLFFDKLVGKKAESHTHVHSAHVKE